MKAPRTDVVVLSALAAAAAAGIAFMVLRSSSASANPLAAVPADSFMVVTIDVVSLAESPIGQALAGENGARAGSLLGVDSITATCGFDPLPHLRTVALAIPEGPMGAAGEAERGDFGVAASGSLAREALESCAKALIKKRGGEAMARQSGSFTVISDGRAPGGAEVAFRDGGPYLVGKGAWLTRMIDAADGRVPSTLSSSSDTHASLRADLAARDVDAEAIRATAILPQSVRARVEHEMVLEAHEGDRAVKAMEGVLGVAAAAFGVHAGRNQSGQDETRFLAELRCDTEAACDAVSTLILHTRLGWSGNLAYRLLGLGPLIDNLAVERQGTALFVRTHAPAGDLAKVVSRALDAPPKKAARVVPTSPDEVFPAHSDAGRDPGHDGGR
ncbi:MAG: hypothetical protein ACLQVI_27990 [Polyangiaceae bacterium]